MDGVDTFTLVASIVVLALGIAAIVGGIWQSRQRLVTAKQAVQWRRGMRQLGYDVPEDMPPRLTDAFILAARRRTGVVLPIFGTGLAVGGFALLALTFVTPTEQQSRLSTLELAECPYTGLVLAGIIGVWAGLSSTPRQPRGTPPRYRMGTFVHWLVPIWLGVDILLVSAVCVSAAIRLWALTPYTPRYSFDVQPIPWVVLIAPIPSLVVFVALVVATRQIAALPPPTLSRESPIAEPYDFRQRNIMIRGLYGLVGFMAFMMGLYSLSYASTGRLGVSYGERLATIQTAFLVSLLFYSALVFLGPHPIQQLRQWSRQRPTATPDHAAPPPNI